MFLSSMSEIIKGYTEAMAYGLNKPRNYIQIILFVLVGWMLVRRAVEFGLKHDRLTALYFFLVLSISLFLSFKSAFVRHDEGHAIIAMNIALVLVCVAFTRLDLPQGSGWKWLVASGLLWFAVMEGFTSWHVMRHVPQWWNAQRNTFEALVSRIQRPQAIPEAFKAGFARIREQHPLPRLAGTMDVYSTNHAVALAHELRWNPRPVLQSYSAYTPELAMLNRAHLLGSNAPDWIWFTVEPIDERLASQEDGASWPVLLTAYQPVQRAQEGLILQRRNPIDASTAPSPGEVLIQRQARLDERVELPSETGPMTLSLQIERNWLGRLLHTAFKARSLMMEVELSSGEVLRKRVVSGMLAGEVLVSPLIENTDEFALLYGPLDLLADKQVRAIRLIETGHGPSHWRSRFDLTLRRATAVGRQPATVRTVVDMQTPTAIDPSLKIQDVSCQGSIDAINTWSRDKTATHRSPLIRARGWTLAQGSSGLQVKPSFLLLRDEHHGWRMPMASVPRPDVLAHLGLNITGAPGWAVIGDIRSLQGKLSVSPAYEEDGQIHACANLAMVLQRPDAATPPRIEHP